jgi:hypothetical protein
VIFLLLGDSTWRSGGVPKRVGERVFEVVWLKGVRAENREDDPFMRLSKLLYGYARVVSSLSLYVGAWLDRNVCED